MRGQHVLKGNIYDDESGAGLFLTTVRLLTQDSVFVAGEATDDNGDFLFRDIKAGEYILALSNVGYVSQFIAFQMPEGDYTLPPVVLKTDVVSLNEIVVKGSTFIRKKDHLLVIPDRQQIKHAFSGYDLLYNLMIPGLTVDRKNKTVTASTGTATIYINGVKADFREVQNLRPRDIEKVEYYSLPTGKYIGDAASVNYITKTYKTGGYVTLEGEQNVAYMDGNYDAGAKISHNHTSYTFFGGYNRKDYDGVKKEKSEELFLADYTVNRDRTTEDADFSNNRQYAQFKVRNDTEKRNLWGQLSFVHDGTPHNDRNETLSYGHDERRIPSSEQVDNESLKPAVSLNGVFNPTEKQQLKVELNGAYTQNRYSRIYRETEQESSTKADEDFYTFDAYGRYTFRPDSKNTFSGSLMHYHYITSSLYSGDYNSWQHLWKGETILFTNYVYELGEKVTAVFNPGCSFLNYRLHGDRLQRIWTFRINTWIRYRFNSMQWIGGGFSRGNYQPNISFVNSMDQTIDFYQIKRGNPYLGNTTESNWAFMYEGRIKALNVQFRLWHDKYANNIVPDYYTENNKLISSYRSDGSFNTANSDIALSCRISDALRTGFSVKYSHMYASGESDLSRDNFVASADVNYFLKSFSVNAHVKTAEKILDRSLLAFVDRPASYGLSVRYSHEKWMAEAAVDNPFTKQARYREQADYGVYQYRQMQTSRIYQQTGHIKLAYTFDFGKKTSREEKNVEGINSAILKAE
ncbi:MAG: carboxypeptidase-like regulatory domain-containing protein [Tannerella sp.]|nr:carboxypeptidase-like regulatory domain-containing protein [Tannerella sp.]